MITAIAYVRVSTEEQAAEGVSVDAQVAAVRAYATLRGLELVDVVIDAGVSAGKPLADRVGGAVVVDAVKRRKVRAVVAVKLDRVFRNAGDCLTTTEGWDRTGVALHLVDMGGQAIDTSSAMGRFFLTVMAGAAEMERNLIRERTRGAMKHKRTQGLRTSLHAPFGYRFAADGDTLEPHPGEQRALELITSLRERGMSKRAIAEALQADGVPARGARWHETTVARALTRMAA
jgi:DNA invertase Pin-like site-specific DNA recombinase